MPTQKRTKQDRSSAKGRRSRLGSSEIIKGMKSVNAEAALRNRPASAQVRVRLTGEAADRFRALLRSTGIQAEAAAAALLSAVLMEHPGIPQLISQSQEASRPHDLRSMTFPEIRDAYRKHRITKDNVEAYLAELSKKHSRRLGVIATEEFHLADRREKKSFYAWIRFLRTAHGLHLPTYRK